MQFLYGLADTKYPRERIVRQHALALRKFPRISLLARTGDFDPNQWSIGFRVAPATLLELCISAVDQLPLPSVFEWSDADIRRWIYRYGFPQYMNTFRVNMIWGRKLLLLDASALAAMNIKDFDHIKRITYGIRMLFHFELTKFSSGVSLPDEKPHELYLLWHTQTGIGYDRERNSDLLRRMQLIRERSRNLDHWDLLDLWLRRERERKYKELRADLPRLEACREETVAEPPLPASESIIWRDSPFDCITDVSASALELLSLCSRKRMGLQRLSDVELQCPTCIPPCECHWPPKYYLAGTVFRYLKTKFPEKFAPTFQEDAVSDVQDFSNRWTRFSI